MELMSTGWKVGRVTTSEGTCGTDDLFQLGINCGNCSLSGHVRQRWLEFINAYGRLHSNMILGDICKINYLDRCTRCRTDVLISGLFNFAFRADICITSIIGGRGEWLKLGQGSEPSCGHGTRLAGLGQVDD
jgi:hypothetical protein